MAHQRKLFQREMSAMRRSREAISPPRGFFMSTQRMLETRRRRSAWGKLLTPPFFPELKSKACAANPRLHLSGTSVLKNLVRAMRKFSLGVFGKTRSLARRTIADNHLYHGS